MNNSDSFGLWAQIQASPSKYLSYVTLFIILGLLIILKDKRSTATKTGDKSIKTSEKKTSGYVSINKNRKYGTWTPENFKSPKPAPFEFWSFKDTKPLPYRAFKHKYNITMGIRNMSFDSWIELDNQWSKYHNEKLKRLADLGNDLHATSPIAIAGAYELLDELRQFLPNRYPTLFQQTDDGIKNLETGEDFKFLGKFRTYTGPKLDSENKDDPSLIAAMLIQDDLAIMVEDEEGVYSLKGGAIILPGFWRLRDKINMPLSQIHTSGDVPKYKEKLQNSMEKFFVRLTCDKPVVRNNYFIQTDHELGWSHSIGDERTDAVGWYTAKESTDITTLNLRSERQSVRRLPKTGAIAFTVRTYFTPITEICKEPYIPRRLFNAIQSWEGDVGEYKGLEKYKNILLPYLEQKAIEQEEQGFLPDDGPVVYPF